MGAERFKYKFMEFFIFDYGSLPYILKLYFWLGVTFPLVALDKIYVRPVPSSFFVKERNESHLFIVKKERNKSLLLIVKKERNKKPSFFL